MAVQVRHQACSGVYESETLELRKINLLATKTEMNTFKLVIGMTKSGKIRTAAHTHENMEGGSE